MNPEFYPISYWLQCSEVYIPEGDSYIHLAYALANEENP